MRGKPISEVRCCDCMEFMKEFPDKFFDLAVVDPPYGINAPVMQMGSHPNRKGRSRNGEKQYPCISTAVKLRTADRFHGRGKLKNRAINRLDTTWDLNPPSKEYFKELFRVSKNQIIWGGNYFTNNLPQSRCWICWDKVQPWDNFSQFELAWTSFNKPTKLYRVSNTGGSNEGEKIHPTQKPIAIYVKCLNDFAEPGFKILDTHRGSDSLRIACYKLELDFYGSEINEKFHKDSCERFDKEINGIETLKNGTVITQTKLFL